MVTAYEGDLVKLDLSNGTKAFTARDLVAGSASLSSRLTTTLGSFTWSQGAGSLSSSHVMNRAASPDGPYSNTSLGLQVSDTDGIGLSLSALNIDSTGDGTADSALAALLIFAMAEYVWKAVQQRLPIRCRPFSGPNISTAVIGQR